MKFQFLAALIWCAVAGLALADSTPPKKKAAAPSNKSASSSTQKSVPQKTVAKKTSPTVTSGHTVAGHSTAAHSTAASGSKVSASRSTKYASYRRPVHHSTAQQVPTADRYREIQDALAAQGYLKTPSTGVWDKDSMDAMQRFQTDKGLEPTGKLTAKSLSALGLGPKPAETTSAPAGPTASLSTNPGSQGTPLQ